MVILLALAAGPGRLAWAQTGSSVQWLRVRAAAFKLATNDAVFGGAKKIV